MAVEKDDIKVVYVEGNQQLYIFQKYYIELITFHVRLWCVIYHRPNKKNKNGSCTEIKNTLECKYENIK